MFIQEKFARIDAQGQSISQGPLNFGDGVFKSNKLLFDGGIDPIIRGLIVTPAKRPQRIGLSVTNNLFGATDLASLNIQRGRDHGLANYVTYRQFCGLARGRTVDDFKNEMLDQGVRNSLAQEYGDVG